MQISIEKQKLSPALYIVSTPIGNLKDITIRALEVLNSADFVACEDTRVTAFLLAKYGIRAEKLIVYNDHSDEFQRNRIFTEIIAGKSVALVSDAGTPLISDPGYKLVREAREQNLNVISVVGACAAIAALSISGLATDKFYFVGFLPKKHGATIELLEGLKEIPASLIFYERGSRVCEALQKILEVFGNRKAAIARELTKKFEEVNFDNLESLIDKFNSEQLEERGEFVLIVDGANEENQAPKEFSQDDFFKFVAQNKNNHKPKDLAKLAAKKFKLEVKQAYDLIVG
jgi:16S rRNA (cytidine1402-2'-O)-methyltransferase